MDLSNVVKLLIWATSTLAANGAKVTVSSPVVADGSNPTFTCTSTVPTPIFSWIDTASDQIIFLGGGDTSDLPKHDNFRVEESTGRSVMTILNIQLEDEGTYNCQVGTNVNGSAIDVEVDSTRTMTLESIEDDTGYRATCTAIGSQPEETITWTLGGVTQTDGVPSDPGTSTDPGLSDVMSVLIFNATVDNYNMPLVCDIGGHLVPEFNGQLSRNLDIHRLPDSNGITINFNKSGDDFTVICSINNDVTSPIPSFSMYYIYRDNALIHESASVNTFTTIIPSECTSFTCVAGNYLGNATSTCPSSCAPTTSTTVPTTDSLTNTRSDTTTATSSHLTTVPGPLPRTCSCLSSGAAAGIAILALLLTASVTLNVVQFILSRRRFYGKNDSTSTTRNRSPNNTPGENDNKAYETIESGEVAHSTYMALKPGHGNLDPLVAADDLSYFTRLGSIGRGAFGGVWKGELRSEKGRVAVAIRQLPDIVVKSAEIAALVKGILNLTHHGNVVACIGYCKEQSSILFEFVSGGTLLTYLQTSGSKSQPTYSNLKPSKVRVDEGRLLKFGWQIAKGMGFLASNGIVHGTLCAHNVLLATNRECMISDYGLSTSLFTQAYKPNRWSSPETITHGTPSMRADIWSFGIVLWEIITLGAKPYPKMTLDVVQREVANGYVMPRPRHCGQELYTSLTSCWEIDPSRRSTFDKIINKLERIMDKSQNYISVNDLDAGVYETTKIGEATA